MPYVGSPVQQSFQSIPSVQRFNGTGSATAFTLDRNVTNVQDVLISVDGVVQRFQRLFNYRGNKSCFLRSTIIWNREYLCQFSRSDRWFCCPSRSK